VYKRIRPRVCTTEGFKETVKMKEAADSITSQRTPIHSQCVVIEYFSEGTILEARDPALEQWELLLCTTYIFLHIISSLSWLSLAGYFGEPGYKFKIYADFHSIENEGSILQMANSW
jgi:hypothetical protein